MKLKIAYFILGLLLNVSTLQAQQGVPAAGGNATGSGGTISYSIGVVNYTPIADTSLKINQGLQHAYEIFIYKSIKENKIGLIYSAYPNPIQDILTLKIENSNFSNTTYCITDITGKEICTQIINCAETTIPFQDFAPATYFITVKDNEKGLKTFKIIKY